MRPARLVAGFCAVIVALAHCQCDHAICFESPTRVDRIELRDGKNQVLWRLLGDGHHKLSNVDYGAVPAGYTQTYPRQDKPRRLQLGEPVLLLWKGNGYFTRHWGKVAGSAVVHYGYWDSGPTNGRQDFEIFVDQPATIDILKGYPEDLPPKHGGG